MLDDEYDEVAEGTSDDRPLSISQLNLHVKQLIEGSLRRVWVTGEVSDLSRPSSGHIYFTLKDQHSQIRAVIWRSTAQRLPFALKDGLSIICGGGVEVYAPRGSYQLIISQLQPKGIGPLQLAFQQLHKKLAAEGLFDPNRKRPLPKFPRHIGFVTSPSGAALHDFLEAGRAIWPNMHLTIIPARVQGDRASEEIVRGIRLAQKLVPKLDLLIVGRGGGSMEDLWCFNEEAVIRALAASAIPTVSAVGHEIDVTLSDLVADVRALTPTQAAQLVLPRQSELLNLLDQLAQRSHLSIRTRTQQFKQRLEYLADRSVLSRPHELHIQRRQMLDEWDLRARSAVWKLFHAKHEKMTSMARATEALSPLGVLARGYSLTQKVGSLAPLTSERQVRPGDQLQTTLHDGIVISEVLSSAVREEVPR
jgi:exodeoxyribonuclease VII large subunit